MTKKLPKPGVYANIDLEEFPRLVQGKILSDTGQTICFYDPQVVHEDDKEVVVEVKWRTQSAGPAIVYDKAVSEKLGREIGKDRACIHCKFSLACITGLNISFQRGLGGWLEDRLFARVGQRGDGTLRGFLKDSAVWEEVSSFCPGVPRKDDQVVQQVRSFSKEPGMVIVVKKER